MQPSHTVGEKLLNLLTSYPILSRKASVEFALITRNEEEISEVTPQPANFITEFPSLFSGLGKVKIEVLIRLILRLDAQLHCLYTPRKIPHPVLQS